MGYYIEMSEPWYLKWLSFWGALHGYINMVLWETLRSLNTIFLLSFNGLI